MKPILYWTLAGSRYGHNYVAFGVTSEGPRDRINGRFADGFPSHCNKRDCTGHFVTQAEAEAKVSGVKAIRASLAQARKPFEAELRQLDTDAEKAINEWLAAPRS